MNGRDLTLGALAGLAVAGLVVQRRRGSRTASTAPRLGAGRVGKMEARALLSEGRAVRPPVGSAARVHGTAPVSAARRTRYTQLAASYTADCGGYEIAVWASDHDLIPLGSGDFRAVFAENDPTRAGLSPLHVLKLNHEDATSSLEEICVWREAPEWLRAYLVPILDYDPKGRWILMAYAEPLYPSSDGNDPTEDGGDASEVIPVSVIRRLRACGVTDLNVQNLSADGRLLDYGWIDKNLWASCAAPQENRKSDTARDSEENEDE